MWRSLRVSSERQPVVEQLKQLLLQGRFIFWWFYFVPLSFWLRPSLPSQPCYLSLSLPLHPRGSASTLSFSPVLLPPTLTPRSPIPLCPWGSTSSRVQSSLRGIQKKVTFQMKKSLQLSFPHNNTSRMLGTSWSMLSLKSSSKSLWLAGDNVCSLLQCSTDELLRLARLLLPLTKVSHNRLLSAWSSIRLQWGFVI